MKHTKTNLIAALLLSAFSLYAADDVKVMQYRHAGPFPVNAPVQCDELNVNGKPFEVKNLLKSSLSEDKAFQNASVVNADANGTLTFAAPQKGYALHLFSFYLDSERYTKGKLEITAPGLFEVYLNGKKINANADITLEPLRYQVTVKYLATADDAGKTSLKAVFKTDADSKVIATTQLEHRYTLRDVMEGRDIRGVKVSPNGKYALVRYANQYDSNKSDSWCELIDAATGRLLRHDNGALMQSSWMPKSSKLYYTRKGLKGTELVTVDPATMQEEVLTKDLPDGSFSFSPDETCLFYRVYERGPKEDPEIIRVLEPQDRLGGFRNRSLIWRYDLRTGVFEQLTFGHNSTSINDISADGKRMLFSTGEWDYTSVPFSRNNLYCLDLQTLKVDTIWEKASYINHAQFSPDGKQLLVSTAPAAFDGIGLNIKKGQIASTYDGQLFLYDLASKKATPLTKTFNPNVMNATWNALDNQIYLIGEDKDYVRFYRCNPANGEIKLLKTSEDIFSSFSMAKETPILYYYGQSASNANRLYAYNYQTEEEKLIDDISADKLKDIELGEVHEWNFQTKDGTTIQGRYYLPPHFDPAKKYPMVVHYYGGATPTTRMLEGRYASHIYAAQGYVVYIINPSGTTGYGQEFSARHVNAWGIRTADEIIMGTKLFCKEHSFVDAKRIGCIGASYGGFMTQYLQTKTDIFAAAISHAGISTLSSYWGEGYWGYTYCSTANTNSYPWNAPDLFTKQSPLYNADKINTPLLLLHGNVDTNVPIGESIQMFAAMKILGKNCEFVQVDGQDHHILDYSKRTKWQNTIFAWFAKWLKDQPEWWDTLYPKPTL